MPRIYSVALSCALAVAAAPVFAQNPQNSAQIAAVPLGYAPVAAKVVDATLILDARIRSTSRISAAEAVGLAPGRVRLLVSADVSALIRGTGAMPSRIEYVVDVPLDSRGREPRLKKQRVLVFARPVAGRPEQIQLTGLDSQMNWSPELDALVRSITREAVAADAPRAILGIGDAFHVPGTLPGEGETQVFVRLAGGGQASLQILRRPGQRPRWSVSLGDFIDESASVPARDTLQWYRLACGLPAELPPEALASNEPENAAIAREDYAFVLREIGPCA